jgi:hypothetical protein
LLKEYLVDTCVIIVLVSAMAISKYNTIRYIIDTFPIHELDLVVLDKRLISISRIFGKKHTIPVQVIEGIKGVCGAEHPVLQILDHYKEPDVLLCTRVYKTEAEWLIRRDAGNKRVQEQMQTQTRVQERANEIAEYEILSHYQNQLDDLLKKREAELVEALETL